MLGVSMILKSGLFLDLCFELPSHGLHMWKFKALWMSTALGVGLKGLIIPDKEDFRI